MEDPVSTLSGSAGQAARFGLAPPRRFVLPAILLVLSERAAHGYSLQKALEEFQLGHIDRPTVYRALAQLESDGLVESWSEAPKTGQQRRVYGVTPLGERVLRVWMSVIKEERDCLGRVLRRYQATGTVDAVLAEVEGGWAAALGFGWSPVSSTSSGPRALTSIDAGAAQGSADRGIWCDTGTAAERQSRAEGTGAGETATGGQRASAPRQSATASAACSRPGGRRFRLVPDRSVVLIEVRSTVGPISFGAQGVSGEVEADLSNGSIHPGTDPTAHIQVRVDGLRSGNSLYDAELLRRIDARRFPTAIIDLRGCTAGGWGNAYRLVGDLTFHGVTRAAEGTVTVDVGTDGRLVVTGEQVFDIRDFDIPSPTVLMLRIYPDVRVRLHVEAQLEEP